MTPDPADPVLVARLACYARALGAGSGSPVVLSHRTGELVVRCGAVVVKAHAAGTDRDALRARLGLAAALPDVLLAPLDADELDGRAVTGWPAGTALRPDQVLDAPWETAGRLLARLHAAAAPADGPSAGGPARVRRALDRLDACPAADGPRARAVRAAAATLPAWTRGAGPQPRTAVCHGDWHLGQLVDTAAGWRLIDADDLGLGEPAFDLARPAAWFAAGVLPPDVWDRFLGAYQAAGGPAVPPDRANPWPALDAPARALTVQVAALAVVNTELDLAEPFVAACRRITRLEARDGVRPVSKLLRR